MTDFHSKTRSVEFCGMHIHRLANVCKSCKSFLLLKNKKSSTLNRVNVAKKKHKSEDLISSKVFADKNEHNKAKTPDHITTNPGESHGFETGNPRRFSGSLPNRKARLSSYSQPLTRNETHVNQINFRRNSVDGIRGQPNSLSRTTSTNIMYSNSTGVIKPPVVEKRLVCTLEEICFGCIKKVKITRDVVTEDREIVQEDKVLTIKVKPGWRNGTRITFEGMGNEVPGGKTGDVTFVIAENKHLLFSKDGDDLVFEIGISLVEALTGCRLSVPLLNGEKTMITMEDVIYPGYQKIVAGQGMPKAKEQGERGDLIVKFDVEFPNQLTDEQRSDVYDILQDSC